MIITNKAENSPVLSNVGQIGEFRIRNSAKAFGILSSGLYANKIRAIIREYSCNAYDSHVEAGRADCPFDVHLPSALDPYFAVRDYGVGLDDEQVRDIFTTYFESTKTASNDVIGGLGLGSKSAFSYTDNFTITTVKAGVKRIYTAFINENGVPSVAPMLSENTTDATGVEIRLSVNDNYDFRKFREEAEIVFGTFRVQPTVTGVDNFTPRVAEYGLQDIIKGAHVMKSGYRSRAVMGNIAYPLEVPNSHQVLGDLAELLQCGLSIEFDIGELDIQASREGLSYIPETIEAIKARLGAIRDAIVVRIANDADAMTNLWDQAFYLEELSRSPLSAMAARQYQTLNPNPLLKVGSNRLFITNITIDEKQLAGWNMRLRGFYERSYSGVAKRLNPAQQYIDDALVHQWSVPVIRNLNFVINTLGKAGSLERARYHYGQVKDDRYVFVVDPINRDLPMDLKALEAALHSPQNVVVDITSLKERPRLPKSARVAVDASVMRLEKRNPSGYSYRERDNDLVWRDAGTLKTLASSQTYYYLPLKGNTPEIGVATSAANLVALLGRTGIAEFGNLQVYGVRKADQATIATMSNWINIEDHVVNVLTSITGPAIDSMAMTVANKHKDVNFNSDIVSKVNPQSPYAIMAQQISITTQTKCDISAIRRLEQFFKDRLTSSTDISSKIEARINDLNSTSGRYPLLKDLSYYADADAVAEYINLIDAAKGI